MSKQKIAIIIGAGPAGLTAAYELLKKTDITPVILERSNIIGGISATYKYKGNRIDVGGHRFFTKSDKVLKWWLDFLPIEDTADSELDSIYRKRLKSIGWTKKRANPDSTDKVMLVRKRKSRILFSGMLLDYPLQLDWTTISKLGARRITKITVSYTKSLLFPIKPEVTLEDFFINRFGKELYKTFFKSYSEKLWGVPCTEINAEWGTQRIKGLSITKAIKHVVQDKLKIQTRNAKKQETSLIDHFLYPKYGPGQLWEEVADEVTRLGGKVKLGCSVESIKTDGNTVVAVEVVNQSSGEKSIFEADYVFSTMAVSNLTKSFGQVVPDRLRKIASTLPYRNFITVGLLLKKLGKKGEQIEDNWLYIQEANVELGRVQIFNNWSPYMVADKNKVWVGLEYFCSDQDKLWTMPDNKVVELAKQEMEVINLISKSDVMDSVVVRMPKAYPAYHGSYKDFSELRKYYDNFKNLYLIGRNGMHRYNNQDHSMLTAMEAVENIKDRVNNKSKIWAVNTEKSYHESQ
jgi:protoporphyrinogen oxidase